MDVKREKKNRISFPWWAAAFWILVWEALARLVNQSLLLVSPLEAARRLIECVEKPNTAGSEPVTIPCKLIRGETVGEVVNTAPVRRP